ncbi:hypothetical protein B0T24DRAFT_662947 [Lasiosphaeria ovina]|uniref:Uncharacterized protein n=1 Tax=Lasiosphaeria ovina TaxID=92902 RepID=A0AAE0NN99_9PEZI|nr:hypothetical protein B0T24DRAFT_662947 [Lasiosphaeria ovina]
MCLAYWFVQPENANVKNLNIKNATAGTSLTGVMNPPTVQLVASPSDQYYGSILFLNFQSGSYNYYDFSSGTPTLVQLPVNGWAIPIQVGFGSQQVAGVPADVQEADESTLPGADTTPGQDSGVKGMLGSLIESYLEVLRGPGSHNIIGYALTASTSLPPGAQPPTLMPTSSRLQAMYYQPLGADSATPGASARNAFLVREMTGNQAMPTTDLTWTGNCFEGSLNGTLLMAGGPFWDGYLLPQLAPYIPAMLSAMNSILTWTLNPTADTAAAAVETSAWILDKNPMPAADTLAFTSNATGGQFKWTGGSDSSTAGGSLVTGNTALTISTSSTLETDVVWSPGSSTIVLSTTASITYKIVSEVRYWRPYTGWTTEPAGTYNDAIALSWTTTLELASVSDAGKLAVSLTQGTPTCTLNITAADPSWGTSGMLEWLDPSFDAGAKTPALAQATVNERVADIDLTSQIAQDLASQQHGFVFPSSGVFDMKSPVFTSAGDLLVGLTYRLGVPAANE